MPIQLEGDFLVTRDLGVTPSIGIQTDKLHRCITAATSKGFEGVFGSPSFGFKERNLNFLKEIPRLRQVWFWDCDFDSIDGLYAVTELQYCGVMKSRLGIDFSRFAHLETAVSHWNPNDTGFPNSTIRHFYLWHYKPKNKSFVGLQLPLRLCSLELNWVNPVSLEGIQTLPELRELGIHRSRNLEDLSQLSHIAPI